MEKIIWLLLFLLIAVDNVDGQNSHEIIITEIFADPTPSKGLPEKEYIELFNNSGKKIETSQYTLFYNSSSVRLPAYNFDADTYLILTRKGNGSLFESYGFTLELSQFSLLNTGALLRLENDKGEIAHELRYDKNWYIPDKQEGYALEMIDISFPCRGFGNWTSSTSSIGGTPGKINSVNASNPDISPPNIENYSLDNKVLTVSFSEPISFFNSNLVSVFPLVLIDSVSLSANSSHMFIFFKEELVTSREYEFDFDGVSDCSGNVANQLSIKISNRPSIGVHDILISELLFDPYSGGEDFVEIKNISGISLNMEELKFYNRGGNGTLRNEVILSKSTIESLILEADSVFCFTRNKEFLLRNYAFNNKDRIIELSDLPSLPNLSGELVISNKVGDIIDEINYSSNWHNATIDNPEGVSLERIDFDRSSEFKENWQSTSGSYDFATPGFIPSRNLTQEFIKVYPEIITPDGDGLTEELFIEFTGINISQSVSIKVFDRFGAQRDQIASNLYVNQGSVLKWSGKPTSGIRLPSGYYFLFLELTSNNTVKRIKVPFVIAYRN